MTRLRPLRRERWIVARPGGEGNMARREEGVEAREVKRSNILDRLRSHLQPGRREESAGQPARGERRARRRRLNED